MCRRAGCLTERVLKLVACVLVALLAALSLTGGHLGELRSAAAESPAPAPAALREAMGIQGGWAIDDAGNLEFPHGLYSQLPLLQETGAGWVRINFRLGAAYRNWTDRGPNGATALEQYDRLLQPRPGALLWVLDGDAAWRGRLYEVGQDGKARYVSPPYWQANQPYFQRVWPNVLPVSWRQMEDFRQRALVGPDL